MDTAIKPQLSSSRFQFDPFVSTWLHPRGDGYGARWAASLGYGISEAFWELIGHRVIAGISSSWARIEDGSPATSALLRLLPRSNWLAGCYRHWDRRAGTEAERRFAVRGFLEHTVVLRGFLLFRKGSNSYPG